MCTGYKGNLFFDTLNKNMNPYDNRDTSFSGPGDLTTCLTVVFLLEKKPQQHPLKDLLSFIGIASAMPCMEQGNRETRYQMKQQVRVYL